MKRSTKLLCICATILLPMLTPAQEVRYHLTIPTTDTQKIDIGPLSWAGTLYNRHFYIFNPTDDTLVYNKDVIPEGFYLYNNGSYELTVPPHEERQTGFFCWKSFFGSTSALFLISRTNGSQVGTQQIPLAMSIDESPDDHFPLRANQYIHYDIPGDADPDTARVETGGYFNSSDTEVTVYGAFVLANSGFDIINVEPHFFPITLLKNDSMRLYFKYDGRSDYSRTIVIVTDPEYSLATASYKDTLAKPTISLHTNSPLTSDTRLLVYPNPATDAIAFDVQDPNAQAHISDAFGRTIIEIGKVFGRTLLDISSLPGGMYALVVVSRERTDVARFIVE